MSEYNRKECEDCGVPEDLHTKAVDMFNLLTQKLYTEIIYLCTKCKDKKQEKHR